MSLETPANDDHGRPMEDRMRTYLPNGGFESEKVCEPLKGRP